jgi:hypothetical protein
MKTLTDYLEVHHPCCGDTLWEFDLVDGKIVVTKNNGNVYKARDENELFNIDEIADYLRVCERCGKPFQFGFTTDDGRYYFCEECFTDGMNELFGEGKWKASEREECGEYGGYYDELLPDGTWEDTGFYYTEWFE